MRPVYIDGCYGVLHGAGGGHGVIVCGSLGDESLNLHRAQVVLAEALAQAGYAALRISYYGTGDSAGTDEEPDRFCAWIDSIVVAADWLRRHCGVTRIALCGVRVGATLAAYAARRIEAVDALILLAPVGSGRRFLREQTLAARTLAEIWHSADRSDPRWFEANGLRLDLPTRDRLNSLDIGSGESAPHGARRVLLLDPPGTPASLRLAASLRAAGAEVTQETAEDSDGLLAEAHEATVPHVTFARIVGWLGTPASGGLPPADIPSAVLDLGDFVEEVVPLGPGGVLAGVLATPKQADRTTPTVLITGTGANPRSGTSRGSVGLARWLAMQGIASLRIDGHGIGDSAPATGEHGQPYAKQGDLDVCAGVDFLASRSDSPVIVFGMCSGAYHAFQAALIDPRIKGVILVNLQKFAWRSGESLSVVQRTTLRTTGFYLRSIVNLTTWRRLLCGEIESRRIARALAFRAWRQLAAAADPAIAAVSGETQVGMVRRQLAELARRSVPILYVLSGNDPGLDEIAEYFGIHGWRLRRSPGVTFHVIDGADHTLSAHWARQHLRQVIAQFLRQRFHLAIPEEAQQRSRMRDGFLLRSVRRRKPNATIDSAPTAA